MRPGQARGWTRERMAQQVASCIPDGSYVNLGLGLPELAADYIPEGREVMFHTENGLLGVGPSPAPGVPPRVMGMGPVPATARLLERLSLTLSDLDLIELNEAFGAQALGCIRELGLPDDDPRVNPLGGAIALGHPLMMSGARLVVTASHQLRRRSLGRALCTMCIGVGQGIAMVVERV